MIAAMRHALPELLASYGSTQVVLNEKMAWFVGCAPSHLQVLHGAAQAFPLLAEILGCRLGGPASTDVWRVQPRVPACRHLPRPAWDRD